MEWPNVLHNRRLKVLKNVYPPQQEHTFEYISEDTVRKVIKFLKHWDGDDISDPYVRPSYGRSSAT